MANWQPSVSSAGVVPGKERQILEAAKALLVSSDYYEGGGAAGGAGSQRRPIKLSTFRNAESATDPIQVSSVPIDPMAAPQREPVRFFRRNWSFALSSVSIAR